MKAPAKIALFLVLCLSLLGVSCEAGSSTNISQNIENNTPTPSQSVQSLVVNDTVPPNTVNQTNKPTPVITSTPNIPQYSPSSTPTKTSIPSSNPSVSTKTPSPTIATPTNNLFQVTRVVDGDTIEVNISGGVYKVRYIGVDTPETVDPSKPVQPYGLEASAKNKELVEGKVVRLEKDISETDQYGRLLRYVYVGDTFVNAELVRLGYAQVATYPPDVKYQSLFLQLQNEARQAGRGLWGLTSPTSTLPTASSVIKTTLTPSKTATDIVYITRTGEKYHRAGCRYLSQSQIAISREDVIKQGYTPCSVCRP